MNPKAELEKLTGLFPGDAPLISEAEHIPASMTPEPYKQMLAHDQHMTVTMERFHDSPVDVKIIDRLLEGDIYSRKFSY